MEYFNKWAVEFIKQLQTSFNLDLVSSIAIVGSIINSAIFDPSFDNKFVFNELKGERGKVLLSSLKSSKTMEEKVENFSKVFFQSSTVKEENLIWARRAQYAWVDLVERPSRNNKNKKKFLGKLFSTRAR